MLPKLSFWSIIITKSKIITRVVITKGLTLDQIKVFESLTYYGSYDMSHILKVNGLAVVKKWTSVKPRFSSFMNLAFLSYRKRRENELNLEKLGEFSESAIKFGFKRTFLS